ncbi:MAG: D-tyrosyl-tRNA(Tyr) deacylase [Myxococcales bacterium]|nr:D-tyrosyl-tRNA(Tyr) deacylase [Myxococcales bacterium]
MRAVIQRCRRASVTVAGAVVGEIGHGLVVLLGAGKGDGDDDLGYVVDKLVNLRIFADDDGKMNRSVLDVAGGVLMISQFTLYADVRKGRRPAFLDALDPGPAEALYERAVAAVRSAGVAQVATGVFRADMQVELVNDGPVTIMIDSRRQF